MGGMFGPIGGTFWPPIGGIFGDIFCPIGGVLWPMCGGTFCPGNCGVFLTPGGNAGGLVMPTVIK